MISGSVQATTKAPVLLILPNEEDHRSLNAILIGSDWNSQFVSTFEQARNMLCVIRWQAIMCEARLTDNRGWKDVLREIQALVHPPPLIVTDRLADEALWAEVLNLGGYDVLMRPFYAREVLHVFQMARQFYERATCPVPPDKRSVASATTSRGQVRRAPTSRAV